MRVVFEGENLFWLLMFYAVGFPSVFYCACKVGSWLGRKLVLLIEKKFKTPKQLSLFK